MSAVAAYSADIGGISRRSTKVDAAKSFKNQGVTESE